MQCLRLSPDNLVSINACFFFNKLPNSLKGNGSANNFGSTIFNFCIIKSLSKFTERH